MAMAKGKAAVLSLLLCSLVMCGLLVVCGCAEWESDSEGVDFSDDFSLVGTWHFLGNGEEEIFTFASGGGWASTEDGVTIRGDSWSLNGSNLTLIDQNGRGWFYTIIVLTDDSFSVSGRVYHRHPHLE